jgi:hypothetical protein
LIIVAMILLLSCGGEYTGTAGMVDLGVLGLVLIVLLMLWLVGGLHIHGP